MLFAGNLITSCEDVNCINAFLKAQINPARVWELEELGSFIFSLAAKLYYITILFLINYFKVFVEFYEAIAQIALHIVDSR